MCILYMCTGYVSCRFSINAEPPHSNQLIKNSCARAGGNPPSSSSSSLSGTFYFIFASILLQDSGQTGAPENPSSVASFRRFRHEEKRQAARRGRDEPMQTHNLMGTERERERGEREREREQKGNRKKRTPSANDTNVTSGRCNGNAELTCVRNVRMLWRFARRSEVFKLLWIPQIGSRWDGRSLGLRAVVLARWEAIHGRFCSYRRVLLKLDGMCRERWRYFYFYALFCTQNRRWMWS